MGLWYYDWVVAQIQNQQIMTMPQLLMMVHVMAVVMVAYLIGLEVCLEAQTIIQEV